MDSALNLKHLDVNPATGSVTLGKWLHPLGIEFFSYTRYLPE